MIDPDLATEPELCGLSAECTAHPLMVDTAAPAGASTFQDWFRSYEGGKRVSWAAGVSAWGSQKASYVFAEQPLTDSTRYQAAVLEVHFCALQHIGSTTTCSRASRVIGRPLLT